MHSLKCLKVFFNGHRIALVVMVAAAATAAAVAITTSIAVDIFDEKTSGEIIPSKLEAFTTT